MQRQENQINTNADVLVIGGGLAGLAATAGLAEQGVQVTLLESRPRLGGRASSFIDNETGTEIDNCQHVVMGCCTNYFHFCKTIGIADQFRTEKELYFIASDNNVNRFASGWLPAPLHLAGAFRGLSYLSKADGKTIATGLRALMRADLHQKKELSFADWLQEQQQPAHLVECFWKVVLVSALSESLDRIDIGHARKVFYDGFLAHRKGWEVSMPTVPLNELYGERLQDWFRQHHTSIHLQTGVEKLISSEGKITGALLRSGEVMTAKHYILAVPHHIASKLLPEELTQHSGLVGIKQLEDAPISSVHFWFDREITPLPHAVLIDRLGQWMFNRSKILTKSETQKGYYYQVIISASHALREQSSDETIQTIVTELGDIWKTTRKAKLLHSRLVTEHRAVFSPMPNVDQSRPPQQSPFANLQLAGDWTSTGWPATMEGAIRSGYLAAQNILHQQGQPATLLQPDLTTSWLTRMLFG